MFRKLKSTFQKLGRDIVKKITSKEDSSTAAVVTIVDKEGKVLILRRGMTAEWQPGKWSLPGGLVHTDELLIDGAQREIYEETSIWLPNLKFCFKKDKVYFYVSRLPLSRRSYKNIKLDFENDEYDWVLPEELDLYDTTPDCKNNILKCLLS